MTIPNVPEATDIEALVLGAMLTDAEAVESILALGSDDFYLTQHRQIHAAAKWLHEHGQDIDRITVGRRLHEQGELESVGGFTYLTGLDTALPRIYGLTGYLGTLRTVSTLRRAAIAAHSLSERLCLPGAGISEIRAAETFLRDLAAYADGQQVSLRTLGEHLDAVGGMDAFVGANKQPGIPTPWAGLNAILTGGGFRPGQLVILAARPGLGKSSAAAVIARTAIEYRPALFSLEMGATEIWHRIVASAACVPLKAVSEGAFDEDQARYVQEAMVDLADAPLRIDDTSMATVAAIVAAVKKLGNVGLVIIDYLQLLAAARKRNNRVEEMSEITRSLKLAARELRVPFLVLSQLSRESAKEDRKPQLHDLRDSGSIEQDADIVAFLYSPANEIREAIAQRRPSELELIVAKNRNGPQGTVKLRFSARTMQMVEIEMEPK